MDKHLSKYNDLKRSRKPLYYITFFFVLLGYTLDTINYIQEGNSTFLIMNVLSASLIILVTVFHFFRISTIRFNYGVIIYLVLINSTISNFLLIDSDLLLGYFLRDSLFLAMLCIFSSFLIAPFHSVVYGGIFVGSSIVLTYVSDLEFLKDNIIIYNTIFMGLSVTSFYLIRLLKKTYDQLIDFNETIIYQNEEILAQNDELGLQANQLKEANKLLITNRHEITQKNKELEQANQTKARFFSIIGHDLRNPFNLILNYSELLSKRYESLSDEKRLSYINILKVLSRNTYRLFENLLNWSTSQSDKIEPVIRYIKLNDLLNQTFILFNEEIKSKQLKIEIETSKCENIFTDKDILDTVIRNIISNAIKYSNNQGTINISSALRNKSAYISVTDNGVGMSPDTLAKLRDKKISNSYPGTDGEIGTGLGLTICREFLRRINGSIEIESSENKGSVFTLVLPQDLEKGFDFVEDHLPKINQTDIKN